MRKQVSTIIGRTLAIEFLEHKQSSKIIAKVDTGAYLGALWASDIHESDNQLSFKLFGSSSDYFNGEIHCTDEYYVTTVENSFGYSEQRFVVKLAVKPPHYGEEYEKIRFSLCDRSMKRYPILLGRDYLRGRFLVDVRLDDTDSIIEDEEKTQTKTDEEEV